MKPPIPSQLANIIRRMLFSRLFIPLFIAMVLVNLTAWSVVWQALISREYSYARLMAQMMDDHLQDTLEAMQAAQSVNWDLPPAESAATLEAIRRTAAEVDRLFVIDERGDVLTMAPFEEPLLRWNFSNQPYTSSLSPEMPLRFFPPQASPFSGFEVLVAALPLPSNRYLIAEIKLDIFKELIRRSFLLEARHTRWMVYNEQGTAFFGGGNALDTTPVQPPTRVQDLNWIKGTSQPLRLATRVDIPTTGWTLVVERAVLIGMGWYVAGTLLTILLVPLLASLLVGQIEKRLNRAVVRPLEILNDRVKQLTAGDYSEGISFSTIAISSREIAELASSIQRMQHTIMKRQQALAESEARYRHLADLLPDMVFETDAEGKLTYANRAALTITAFSDLSALQNVEFSSMIPLPEVPAFQNLCRSLTTGQVSRPLVLRFLKKDGTVFPGEVIIAALGNGQVHGYRIVARDITERLSFEEALRRSYQMFIQGPVVVFRARTGGNHPVEYVSPNVTRFGYTPSRFTTLRDFYEVLIHPHDRERIIEQTQAHLTAKSPTFEREYRVRCADGSIRWVYDFNTVSYEADGNVRQFAWYLLDITERKQAELRLDQQIQRLAALQLIDASITANADLKFTLQLLISQLTTLLKVDAAAVLRYNGQEQALTGIAGDGFLYAEPEKFRLAFGESYAGRIVQSRQKIVLNNVPDELMKTLVMPGMKQEGFVSFIGLPLIAKGEVKGVLEIFQRQPLTLERDWMDYLETLAGQAAIAIYNADLLENLQRSNEELRRAYEATIQGFSIALERRDKETEGHSRRVAEWTVRLARRAGIPEEELERIRIGAILHDIGKMAIPDSILLKEGNLTEEEWEIMRRHPEHAARMLSAIEYLRPAIVIPQYHHEKWDGTGYPYRLKGEEIPLAARVFAVVDVWDALSFDRPYRTAWKPEQVRQYLIEQAGRHFDPRLVPLFLEMLDEDSSYE
ncbi:MULTISPECIES: HD domain-containing phosphohydrolase [Anaerolinea]|uniref:HD domain-containing phosphohydrolase n=1 Tax=Anaerolinea TaxID=233189 RepID=UPI002624FAA2|nr:HD domain-containing phosphohydrolase [Anaerolinea thermophila]